MSAIDLVKDRHGFGISPLLHVRQECQRESPVRALPASWYTSQAMYEFERRAIFSKRWLLMTHSSRVKNTGDWLRYSVAGYDLIITKNRQGNINAFHNTCRHRAYPVIEKEGSGNAKILACRYHGWSYGKLAKAPGYQDLTLDKEENSLFPIHTKVDRNGFIWINLDAAATPEVSWDSHLANVDIQDRYTSSGINFADYDLDHTYQLDGHYNWKILADNFNECYHCPTTHPDIPAFLNLESFDSALQAGHIQHHCAPTPEQVRAGVNTHSTYSSPCRPCPFPGTSSWCRNSSPCPPTHPPCHTKSTATGAPPPRSSISLQTCTSASCAKTNSCATPRSAISTVASLSTACCIRRRTRRRRCSSRIRLGRW